MSVSGQPISPTRLWRVFYTKPRAEKVAAGLLEDHGIEILLPVRIGGSARKVTRIPLFPSYLFAHVSEAERLTALSADPILRCISMSGQPVTVSESEINSLMITQRDPSRIESAAHVEGGTKPHIVQLAAGPLEGLTGRSSRDASKIVLDLPSIRQNLTIRVTDHRVVLVKEVAA